VVGIVYLGVVTETNQNKLMNTKPKQIITTDKRDIVQTTMGPGRLSCFNGIHAWVELWSGSKVKLKARCILSRERA